MHIALVHRDLHRVTRGGINAVYRALAGQFTAAGHRTTLITQATTVPLVLPHIETITLPRTEDLVSHRQAVADAVHGLSPDIAECSTWEAELLDYARIPPQRRAPVLVRADLSAHTMGARDLASAEHDLLRHAQKAVAVSRWTAQDIQAAYGAAAEVLPNGVDRSRFRPGRTRAPITSGHHLHLDEHGHTRASVSLADDVHDTDTLWKRLAPTPSQRTPSAPTRLLWVGKMTEMKGFDRLQDLILALAGRAVFTLVLGHGWVQYPVRLARHPHVQVLQDLTEDDLAALYRSADFLLSTSRWEGFGLAIAEALACGTPALLPAGLGTADELITDHVTGARYRDADDLATLLTTLPVLQGRLPEDFDWTANATRTLHLYQQLIHTRPARRRP